MSRVQRPAAPTYALGVYDMVVPNTCRTCNKVKFDLFIGPAWLSSAILTCKGCWYSLTLKTQARSVRSGLSDWTTCDDTCRFESSEGESFLSFFFELSSSAPSKLQKTSLFCCTWFRTRMAASLVAWELMCFASVQIRLLEWSSNDLVFVFYCSPADTT